MTLTGPPGKLPVLDLQFKPGVLHICSNCTFTTQHVILSNERASGTSYTISILQGDPGSKLELKDGLALHHACLSTEATKAVFTNTARSPLFPNTGDQQLIEIVNMTYKVILVVSCCSRHTPVGVQRALRLVQ